MSANRGRRGSEVRHICVRSRGSSLPSSSSWPSSRPKIHMLPRTVRRRGAWPTLLLMSPTKEPATNTHRAGIYGNNGYLMESCNYGLRPMRAAVGGKKRRKNYQEDQGNFSRRGAILNIGVLQTR